MEQVSKNVEIIHRKNPSAGGDMYRLNLPVDWARDMGITDKSKAVRLTYTDNKIIIEKEPE